MSPIIIPAPGAPAPGVDHGQPGFYVPALGPFAYQSGSTLVASRAYGVRFVCPRSQTISKIAFVVYTAATADDPVDVGIFSADCTLMLGSSGSTLGRLNSTGVKQINLQAPVPLVAGTVYYAAMACGPIGGTAGLVVHANAGHYTMMAMYGSARGTIEVFHMTPNFPLTAPFTTLSGIPQSGPILALQQ